MSFSVNPSVFKSIFAVPTDIVDKHIRLANGHQLKVLLWILRNSPDRPDLERMCKDLKIDMSDAQDYLQYWVLTGVLSGENNEIAVQPSAKTEIKEEIINITPSTVKEQKPVIETVPSKPSSIEIADRIDETPEIGHLFTEAQAKLGKTIGYDGQCTLLLLHDHYGLPVDVLFMLIDYCVSIGKTNYSYIQAVGKDWGLREIDTLDKAAEQITILRKTNTLWRDFAKYAGIVNPRPTMKQAEHLRKWSGELKFSTEMILLAYEEMADHTGKINFNYIEKILLNWHSKGYKTPEDVENAVAEQKERKPGKESSSSASYDLDEFKERSLHGELKYERKKKK